MKQGFVQGFNRFVNWISVVLSDETKFPSSKRVAGLLIVVTLCIDALIMPIDMGDTMVMSLCSLAFGCLGLTEVSKFLSKKEEIKS
jgi:hypothetical protein